METEFEEVDKMAQAVRRKRSRPLTKELQAAYYQRMSPELRKQWDLLAPEEQVMILEVLEEYHQVMEHELSHFVSGLIQVLIKRH
ncbi:unnamed protein product [marine sediment metagenome]|uniref:Uncharacterized protein n=1 Tax=marine sediment metagenome TaxID=412755 RepID=X0T1C1_9ZZZZ